MSVMSLALIEVVALVAIAAFIFLRLQRSGSLHVDHARLKGEIDQLAERAQAFRQQPWSMRKTLLVMGLVIGSIIFLRLGMSRIIILAAVVLVVALLTRKSPPIVAVAAPIEPERPDDARRPKPPFRPIPPLKRLTPAPPPARARRGFFYGVVRALGLLLMVAVGLTGLAIISSEVRIGRELDEQLQTAFDFDPDNREKSRRDGATKPFFVAPPSRNGKKPPADTKPPKNNATKKADPQPSTAVPNGEQVASPEAPKADQPPVAIDEIDDRSLKATRVVVESGLAGERRDAEAEAIDKLCEFAPRALAARYPSVDFGDWKPSPHWVKKWLVESEDVASVTDADGDTHYRAKLIGALRAEQTEAAFKRFVADRDLARTLRIAKGFAGTVLILGGLSLVTRIGAGRRLQS